MLAKTRRGEQGRLTEPSVVQTPRARLVGGIPNAAFGMVYYLLLAIGIWIAGAPWQVGVRLAASLAATAMSIALAYSLVVVTRMPCPYCWTSHAVNALLSACLIFALFKISYWH